MVQRSEADQDDAPYWADVPCLQNPVQRSKRQFTDGRIRVSFFASNMIVLGKSFLQLLFLITGRTISKVIELNALVT